MKKITLQFFIALCLAFSSHFTPLEANNRGRFVTSTWKGILACFLTIFTLRSNGEVRHASFIKTLGGRNDDFLHDLTITPQGDVWATGGVYSYGEGDVDVAMTQYNLDGELLSSYMMGDEGANEGLGIEMGLGGTFFVTGYTENGVVGGLDAFIASLNVTDIENGPTWGKAVEGMALKKNSVVGATKDGGCILATSTDTIAQNNSDHNPESIYIVVVKFNKAGDVDWSTAVGGKGDDYVYAIEIREDDSFLLTGETTSGELPGTNLFVAAFDSDGYMDWANSFGGAGEEKGYGVTVSSQGTILVIGTTNTFGQGGLDILLLSLGMEGKVVHAQAFGGSHDDIGHAIAARPHSGFIIGATIESYGAGGKDGLVATFNDIGILIRSKVLGAHGDDTIRSILAKSDDAFFAVGDTTSYRDGDQDMMFVKTDIKSTDCTNIATPQRTDITFEISSEKLSFAPISWKPTIRNIAFHTHRVSLQGYTICVKGSNTPSCKGNASCMPNSYMNGGMPSNAIYADTTNSSPSEGELSLIIISLMIGVIACIHSIACWERFWRTFNKEKEENRLKELREKKTRKPEEPIEEFMMGDLNNNMEKNVPSNQKNLYSKSNLNYAVRGSKTQII